MTNVIVVDDSPIVRAFLVHVLNADPEICVVATAANGKEAIVAVTTMRPDVVLMDLNMPIMSGLEATRHIMLTCPVPIIIVTSSQKVDKARSAFEAMEAGAVTVVSKPDNQDAFKKLVNIVKLMSEVKLTTRFHTPKPSSLTELDTLNSHLKKVKIIGIGVSTGGPPVLQTILKNVLPPFPPVLIVQHITPEFLDYLVDWLQQTTNVPIHVAKDGEMLCESHVYFAPNNYHMEVTKNFTLKLTKPILNDAVCPSVSHLFRSINDGLSDAAMAILLTGMGTDGVEELKLLRENGAMTLCQSEETCVINGMPGAAQEINAALYVLTPAEIVKMINKVKS